MSSLGNITDPVIKDGIKYMFYDIACENEISLPLISLTNHNKKGKFIHIYSDEIALNFLKIPELKKKISENLN